MFKGPDIDAQDHGIFITFWEKISKYTDLHIGIYQGVFLKRFLGINREKS